MKNAKCFIIGAIPLRGPYRKERAAPVCADGLSKSRLKNQLCSAGPALCGVCRGCAYGREWAKRYETEESSHVQA